MGAQRGQMKGVLFPGWFTGPGRAGARDFCSILAALFGPVENNIFPHRTLFPLLCPHRLAKLTGSRAGSPVS
jgi:hypothetical protein